MSETDLSISYDLVARELVVDLGEALPPISIALPSVTMKLYLDDGVIAIGIDGGHINAWFYPVEPGADADFKMIARHHWRVVSTPGSTESA